MAKVITLAMLIENEACEGQVKLFKEYFGDSVEITDEVCFKYYDKFDVEFITTNFLNDSQKKVYQAIQGPAYEAYEAIVGPAYEAYKAIKGPAWEAYAAIEGPAREAYEAIEGSAWEAYEAIQGPAYEDYLKKATKAFWLAYNS